MPVRSRYSGRWIDPVSGNTSGLCSGTNLGSCKIVPAPIVGCIEVERNCSHLDLSDCYCRWMCITSWPGDRRLMVFGICIMWCRSSGDSGPGRINASPSTRQVEEKGPDLDVQRIDVNRETEGVGLRDNTVASWGKRNHERGPLCSLLRD